jgi:hypothetical protein
MVKALLVLALLRYVGRQTPERVRPGLVKRHPADLYRNVSERRIDTKHWISPVFRHKSDTSWRSNASTPDSPALIKPSQES